MHPIDPLSADLARTRIADRLREAGQARRARACRPRRRRAGWTRPRAVCSLAALGLALAIGSVTASPGDGRNDAGDAAPGAVIAADAEASGLSVAVIVQTSGIPTQPLPGMGAPGQAASEAMPEPRRAP